MVNALDPRSAWPAREFRGDLRAAAVQGGRMGAGRRRSRKRVVHAVAASTALLAATAGCGGGGSGGGNTLTMWTFKQTHVKALEAAAAGFKAKTGITVKI